MSQSVLETMRLKVVLIIKEISNLITWGIYKRSSSAKGLKMYFGPTDVNLEPSVTKHAWSMGPTEYSPVVVEGHEVIPLRFVKAYKREGIKDPNEWNGRACTLCVNQSEKETKVRKHVSTIPFDYCTQASLEPPWGPGGKPWTLLKQPLFWIHNLIMERSFNLLIVSPELILMPFFSFCQWPGKLTYTIDYIIPCSASICGHCHREVVVTEAENSGIKEDGPGKPPNWWSQEVLLWSWQCDRSWVTFEGHWRTPKLRGPWPTLWSCQNLLPK